MSDHSSKKEGSVKGNEVIVIPFGEKQTLWQPNNTRDSNNERNVLTLFTNFTQLRSLIDSLKIEPCTWLPCRCIQSFPLVSWKMLCSLHNFSILEFVSYCYTSWGKSFPKPEIIQL